MKLKQAIEVRNRAVGRIDAIRVRDDLSNKKKTEMIAAERERANKTITDLRDGHTAERAAQRETLKSRLFGLGHKANATEADKHAAITSFRDAQFRVAGLGSQDEARRLLQRARMSGDRLLARAIGSLAYENGWDSLTKEYADGEGALPTLEELGALDQSEGNRTRQFETSVAFTQIPETEEERDARQSFDPAAQGTGQMNYPTAGNLYAKQ